MKIITSREDRHCSCIYFIKCTTNKKFYIGSTNDLQNRILNGHLRELNHNSHTNPKLQNLFNKHGIEKFVVEVKERVPEERLLIVEQFYLDRHFHDKNCLNINPVANKPPSPHGRKKSAEELEQSRLRMKQMWQLYPEKLRQTKESIKKGNKTKQRNGTLGKNNTQKGLQAMIENGKTTSITLKNIKTGEIRTWPALSLASREIGVGSTAFINMIQNKQKSAKGWCLPETDISKTGKQHSGYNRWRTIIIHNLKTDETLNFKTIKDAECKTGISHYYLVKMWRNKKLTINDYEVIEIRPYECK